MREIVARISREAFGGETPFVIGTGGFSRLFERDQIFDVEIPDLVLFGLCEALNMNAEN
jgi:type III pantothenate kinase